ncbi:MAG: hypothetical protein Q8926_08705 [Bacteroidota bacterium]|nr:hypothetical protein [Bacteroidota bacterium]
METIVLKAKPKQKDVAVIRVIKLAFFMVSVVLLKLRFDRQGDRHAGCKSCNIDGCTGLPATADDPEQGLFPNPAPVLRPGFCNLMAIT